MIFIEHLIKVLLLAVVFVCLWFVCRLFCFDYFSIPSESMQPTLWPGDKVVVNKLIMGARIYKNLSFDKYGQELESWRLNGYRNVKHNDIVVFNYPLHEDRISFLINHVYCKRVAALPGDSLSIINGHYKNNNYQKGIGVIDEQNNLFQTPDSMLYGRPFRLPPYNIGINWTMKNYGPVYVPRAGDVISITPIEAAFYRPILEWETGCFFEIDSTRVLANGVPFRQHEFQHNYYFMAGDFSSFSIDSRHWGLVPEEYIVGVVGWILSNKL